MRLAALLFLTTLMAGCMSYPDTGEAGADQNLLTGQEVMDSGETNLYDAVMRLRPRWIRPNTVVYMDGVSLGGTDALRDWPQDTAISLEWLDPMQAMGRIPEFNPSERDIAGVILIRTR